MVRILITAALPYVNAVPHLGNLVGSMLPADVISRYHKQVGHDVLFVCGTDEYGTATCVKAEKEGLTPRATCDKYRQLHEAVYKWFNIDFDIFGRTSTADPEKDLEWPHTVICQKIFLKLYENGYLEERMTEQLYSESKKKFVVDRLVMGTCPKCGQGARGDQCDHCQSVYESVELKNPTYGGEALTIKETRHMFLRLDLLQPRLEEWFETICETSSTNVSSITRGWFKEGLKARCITRDIQWGTPVGMDEYDGKVMYNWFDAPIGYISIAGEDEWLNRDRIIQFMGYDNVFFHSIFFPGILMGADLGYNMVTEIVSCKYLTYEGGKFSKTNGHGIFGDDVMQMGIPNDYWRYFLCSRRAEDDIGSRGKKCSDSDFTVSSFVDKCNADLVKNIGNLIHRIWSMICKYMDGVIDVTGIDLGIPGDIVQAYETSRIRVVIDLVLQIASQCNRYVQQEMPWKMVDDDKRRECLTCLFVDIYRILVSMKPIMPEKIGEILGYIEMDGTTCHIKTGFKPFFQFIKSPFE